MKLKSILTVLLSTSFIMASLPSYASFWGRKYSEIQINQDTFVINITATSTTKPAKALSGLLTRAAEITLKNGYEYFIILDSQDQSVTNHSSYLNYRNGFATSSSRSNKVPHGQMTIKCFKKDPKKDNAVNAKFFLKTKKS